MKFYLSYLLFIVTSIAYSQIDLEGRWKLDNVNYQGKELFDRASGPQVNSTDRINVTFKTADENFNQQMNQNPFSYFSNSEIVFMDDSMFYRISTSITNGAYKNEVHFGDYILQENTSILALDIRANQKVIQTYSYSFTGDLLTLTNGELIAIYKKEPHKITGEFDQAWNDPNVPIIIDAYHLNDIQWDVIIQDPKVHGIIHKAGQGKLADPKYSVRKSAAKKRNLLWGSYFLGTDDDPIEQANFYYEFTGGDSTELHCLDLEDVNAKGMMSLKQAEKFINRWHELTGKYPVLYCNNNVLKQIDKKYGPTSVFAKCPLWYARFRPDIPAWESSTWETYTFWQFSSEINCEKDEPCLYSVPGTAFDMDINVFNGTFYELRILWPNL